MKAARTDPQEAMLLEHFRACDVQGRNALVYFADRWRSLDATERSRLFQLAEARTPPDPPDERDAGAAGWNRDSRTVKAARKAAYQASAYGERGRRKGA